MSKKASDTFLCKKTLGLQASLALRYGGCLSSEELNELHQLQASSASMRNANRITEILKKALGGAQGGECERH